MVWVKCVGEGEVTMNTCNEVNTPLSSISMVVLLLKKCAPASATDVDGKVPIVCVHTVHVCIDVVTMCMCVFACCTACVHV